MCSIAQRMPTFFLPHGGGPCFFMDWNPPQTWRGMETFLRNVLSGVPKPKAVLVVTAHWEEDAFTVGAHPSPDLIYDYYGFPDHTYQLTYPAKGVPELADEIAGKLKAAGLPSAVDPSRGLDHGVFIPFKVIYPEADIPIIPMSLHSSMDPELHIRAGEALQSLRDEGIVIVGSGMSFHNLRLLMSGHGNTPASQAFDAWLTEAAIAEPAERKKKLGDWTAAPGARHAHPREEHLLPMMVAAGAAGTDKGERVYNEIVMNAPISGYRFGI